MQILVLYFSRHGSTERLARQICRGVETVLAPSEHSTMNEYSPTDGFSSEKP